MTVHQISFDNFLDSLVEPFLNEPGARVNTLYFSRKNVLFQISLDLKEEKQKLNTVSNPTNHPEEFNQNYYILKLFSEESVNSLVAFLNEKFWMDKKFKLRKKIMRSELSNVNFNENEFSDEKIAKIRKLASFHITDSVLPHELSFLSSFDQNTRIGQPANFKIQKLIRYGPNYSLLEYINGITLSELMDLSETLPEELFECIGRGLAELNGYWKIDLVDCNFRNFIIQANQLDNLDARTLDFKPELLKFDGFSFYIIDFEDARKIAGDTDSEDCYHFIEHLVTMKGGIFEELENVIAINRLDGYLSRFMKSYNETILGYPEFNNFRFDLSKIVERIKQAAIRRNLDISYETIHQRLSCFQTFIKRFGFK